MKIQLPRFRRDYLALLVVISMAPRLSVAQNQTNAQGGNSNPAEKTHGDILSGRIKGSASNWCYISLPVWTEPLAVSKSGVVLLRTDAWHYYRWKNGNLLELKPSDYINIYKSTPATRSGMVSEAHNMVGYSLNENGAIALNFRYSLSEFYFPLNIYTTEDHISVWYENSELPVVFRGVKVEDDNYVASDYRIYKDRIARLVGIDGVGAVWGKFTVADTYSGGSSPNYYRLESGDQPVSSEYFGYQNIIHSSFSINEFSNFDIFAVNQRGHPIGFRSTTRIRQNPYSSESNVSGVVGSMLVDFLPLYINDNSAILGTADFGAIPAYNGVSGEISVNLTGAQFIQFPNGIRAPLPSNGRVTWIDALDRPNGFTPSGYPVVWVPRSNEAGAVTGQSLYDRILYVPLPVPTGYQTDHLIAPGSSSMQLGFMTNSESGQRVPFLAIPAALAVDANRDGSIKLATDDDSDTVSSTQPFRFWSNDDDDSGDMGGDDIPGKITGANYADGVVNGTRDLVDFFPVFLDLKQLVKVLPPSTSVKYKLKQADSALNFVYTNQTRGRALDYQTKILATGFGDQFDQKPGMAMTHQITAAGVELSTAFLTGVKDSEWGVLLIEGRATTTAPLVLSVEKDGASITEVKLELRISNVEDMFRHIDLTDVSRTYNGTAVAPPVPAAPPRTGDPGAPYPDSSTNGKYFVFAHGFNVNGQRARGWNAEVFKRLYQLGSHARFVGVTWNGATGVQLLNGSYTDYHQAVYHAFQTGDALASRLTSNGVTGDVTIAAHSLGNMVASQAIQYGGFLPTRYYMINAAVPVEAYHLGSVGSGDLAAMTNVGWQNPPFSNDSGRLFAANWYLLFAGTGDHRSELTWKGRFADVLQSAYNFYSPGDEVVEDARTSSPSLLLTVINQGFTSNHGAWGLQELAKGTFSIASVFFSRTQAGWGQSITGKESPFDANPTSVSLKEEPFFASFNETDLLSSNPITASAMAGQTKVQYDVLARGIPALSFATAVHPLAPLGTSKNFNMEIQGRTQNQWPTEGHTNDGRDVGRWLHSDFKNVPLPYVFQMYQEMINKGSLQ